MSISSKTTFNPQKEINDLTKKVIQIIDDEMLDAVLKLEKNSPVGATGDLKNSWDLKPTKLSGGEFTTEIFNTAPFSLNRLEGRGSGRQPPSKALESWVAAKLGLSGKEVARVAFLVARKIGQEGTIRSKRNFKEFNPATGEPAKNGFVDRAIQKIEKRIDREL